MLDVEIVIFDIGENRACQAEFLLENRSHILIQKLGVFLGDAIALGGNFRSRPFDLGALFHLGDVVAQIAERDIEVLDPILVGGVEAVS